MTKKEQRVIRAFINCVRTGQYTYDYACLLIEDTQRYGYLTEEAKEVFYSACEPVEEEEQEIEEESEAE